MKNTYQTQNRERLNQLCHSVRAFVIDSAYESCLDPIRKAMAEYPDAPEPHNLLGIVLEKMGDHALAMRHFRAAWALDPTYRPANHNMRTYATFYSGGKCAFDESDLARESEASIQIVYDERGVGHAVSRWKLEYDKDGNSHKVRRNENDPF